ncbi:hypothetical protein F5Y06DRAFT_291412 [Hypoxylon sp. FL0890]|nr:hypothetical protein F5Y06DRAFT_291412 [Hypoxylon sp. FL0890]
MDPFTAIGLAGNIITFLDFGYKLVSTAKDIYTSASGAGAYNDGLSYTTEQIQQLTANLKVTKPLSSLSKQELSLLRVAGDCESVSVELAKLLDKLKARKPGSKREALRATIRNWQKKDQKDDLELKLDRCKQQLNLELVNLSRSESLERLNKLIAYGQASGDELQSLAKNIDSLRLGCNVSCLGSEALDQIRSLLKLTDDAIWKVCQARILDALRFELMNERFEDIKEAYQTTFDWIFSGDEAGTDEVEYESNVDNDSTDEYDDGELEHRREDDVGEYNEVNPINSSQVSIPVSNSPRSTVDDEAMRHDDHTISLDSEITELSDDSSFEWHSDDTSSIQDRQVALLSDDEESVKSVKTPSRARSLSSAPPDVDDISKPDENLIKARNGFITWLEQDTGIFYISGKPGSGKSTLMKYLTRHPKTREYLTVWADGKKLVLGSFFSWKPGSALQKSIKGLVRGMLYCILEEYPDLIPLAFPVQWEASMHKERVHIEHHQCQQAFEKIVTVSQAEGGYKMALFIDGLDEFEENHGDLIRQLLAWTNGGQNVKLCVASREWAIFQDAFKDYPKLRLHELTSSDIKRFVRDRFREMHINTLLANQDDDGWDCGVYKVTWLREKIVKESAGVFLWVSLVLRHVEEGLVNGDRLEDLMRLIESLPTDLESMFQQLLGSIPRNNRRLAYSMLSLAHFCSRYKGEVSVMHYSLLEEYVENKNFAMESASRPFTAKENRDKLERTQRRIYGLCKGLLELSSFASEYSVVLGRAVRLIHRSITEFLESQYFKQGVNLECPDFEPFDAYCQTYLGLMQRVHLPRSYFANNKRSVYLQPTSTSWKWSVQLESALGLPLNYTSGPSFRQDMELRILHQITLGRQEAVPRFCKFLDTTYQALLDQRIDVRVFLRGKWVWTYCSPQDLIMLGCAQLGFYEYFDRRQNISINSELTACCISACLLSIDYDGDQNRAFKTLETLFDRGASPDPGLLPGRMPAFHKILQTWCYQWDIPNLATIAFMLYHGVNPRFSMVISKTKYIFASSVLKCREGAYYFKANWRSVVPVPGPEHGWTTIRVSLLPGCWSTVEATPKVLDVLSQYGHKIDLRTLISIWFPDQSAVLQQVIDWIIELGVPVNASHRSLLQDRFGSLLRPFFDPDHPDFVEFKLDPQQYFLGYTINDRGSKRKPMFLLPRRERSRLKRCHEAEKGQRSGNK